MNQVNTYQWTRYDEYKTLNERVGAYYETVHQCLTLALQSQLSGRCKRGLDIACGHGESTKLLSQFADSVVGVDSSEDLISVAHQQEPEAHFQFICSSFEDFSDDDGSFDIISAAWYLNHVHSEPELEAVIAKIASLLAPGGQVAFVIPGDSFTSRNIQQIGRESFGWKQAWYQEEERFTRGVFAYGEEWIPTTVWQPIFLMRLLSRYFDIHSWDVKGTIAREERLVGFEAEPPFEILYGQLRKD